ncbi:MAG: hypothetical protein Q7T62_00565 [Undibacterium sp.]|nr:hypothetical protein [Undibacterium sp.]
MQTHRKINRTAAAIFLTGLCLSMLGCASMLPNDSKATKSSWTSYQQAETAFASIITGETTLLQLKAMGVDPATTPNVALLSHADLLRRLNAMVSFEWSLLDPAIKTCVSSRQNCYAYQLEQTSLKHDRVGNFWLDFLNFKRVTNVTGWQFDALVIIDNDLVVYKSWSGKPNIHEVEQARYPLGPLQGIGASLVRY